jgi:hypothetical protein
MIPSRRVPGLADQLRVELAPPLIDAGVGVNEDAGTGAAVTLAENGVPSTFRVCNPVVVVLLRPVVAASDDPSRVAAPPDHT